MSLVIEIMEATRQALNNVAGNDKRSEVCRIVVADAFNSHGIDPLSTEGNNILIELNEEGLGFFNAEIIEISRLAEVRKLAN